MGTLSSDNHLLAEPLSSGGCSEGHSKSAATSVFSGKIHSDSTGGFKLYQELLLGVVTAEQKVPKAMGGCLSLFHLSCYFVKEGASLTLPQKFTLHLKTRIHLFLVSLLLPILRLF